MEKKFSEAFDDEILDSKKPAGCIGGIFQLFDCQQLLGGKHLSEQGNRRGPSANAPVSPRISLSCKLDKNQSRSQDNSRYSMESSRTSFSSTFTSFSSLEHKSPQERPICTHHSIFSGRSPRSSISSPRTSATDINKFPAFKEIIKESIYKDLCSPIIKEDDNKRNKVLKTIHSPRPMDSSKVNDLEESLRIVLKLKGSPRSVYDGHSNRFSYDGTEISQAHINVKQYSKHGGLSRLSLDSREGSPRCNLSPTFNNSTMKEFDKNGDKRVPATLNRLQDLAGKEKNSSIVAKLMGLEPLNSDTKNNIRYYDPFNEHDNQIVGNERKQEKPVQSPRNIARPPRRNNPHLDSPSKFSKEATPQMAPEYVDENMKEKIKSVFNEGEKRLQKLQFRHFNKELQNLKRVIIEAKKNGTKHLSSVNSLSTQLTPTNYRSNKVFKTPIVVMEPARKLDVSFSEVTNLEGLPALGKIRTSDSESDRKKGFANTQTNTEQTFTENKVKCRGPHSLSKIQNERAVNNTVSPRLQQIKPELKMKASASIPNYDTSKSPRRAVNSQLLDSVSPISKLRKKSNKVQDIELQKSRMQVHMESTRAKNSIEVKPLPSEKRIQSLSVKGSTGVALVSAAKKHPAILEDISAKEIILVSPRLSSHKSVPDALLKQDGYLHSPESVLKVFKEYQNLLPDRCNFTMERPLPTDSKISKIMNDASVPNANIFELVNQDGDNRVVAETFPVCALPQGESDLLSMLDQNTTDKSSEFVQTSNPQKLHQKLIFDVVNEILAQKMDASSSCDRFHHLLHPRSSSFKQLYKEICSEIKCLQSCKEENLDDNSMIHKDANWHSQVWNRFECEIPVLVLEIERLIFKDLINDVVNGL